MNNHDKPISGVEATANPAPSQGRRRLVKGAMLATPAVMTLMSGRLASATSVLCRDKSVPLELGLQNEDGLILAQEGDKLGYYDANGVFSEDTTLNLTLLGTQQTAFHSATCWNSAYPSQ